LKRIVEEWRLLVILVLITNIIGFGMECFLKRTMEEWRLLIIFLLLMKNLITFGMEQQDMDAWKF